MITDLASNCALTGVSLRSPVGTLRKYPQKRSALLEQSRKDCILDSVPHPRLRGRLVHEGYLGLRLGGIMAANVVLQNYLDEMSHSVMSERFEDYSALVQLPLRIVTTSATLTVTTLADLEDGFDDFTDMMLAQGVTELRRTVHEAAFQGKDGLAGIYETRMLNGTELVVPVFYSKMWLIRVQGAWKVTRVRNTCNDGRWPMLFCDVQPVQGPPEELLE